MNELDIGRFFFDGSILLEDVATKDCKQCYYNFKRRCRTSRELSGNCSETRTEGEQVAFVKVYYLHSKGIGYWIKNGVLNTRVRELINNFNLCDFVYFYKSSNVSIIQFKFIRQ